MKIENVPLDTLTPHPRNYKIHPQPEIDHIKHSLEQHTQYKNIVISNDNVILAGHAVVVAAKQLDMKEITVHRLPYSSTDIQAIKTIVSDNEQRHLAERDDQQLLDLLQQLQKEQDLFGTGYDEEKLVELLFHTTHATDVENKNEAAANLGVDDYEVDEEANAYKLIILFETEELRQEFHDKASLPPAANRNTNIWFNNET